MKLRSKLLLVTLTLLLLPWAGLLILQAFEGMLRKTSENAGLEAVRTSALLLATQTEFFDNRSNTFRPMALGENIRMDGVLTDWPGLLRKNDQASYALAADNKALWLALQLQPSQPAWYQSQRPLPRVDHIQLKTSGQAFRIAANRPGRITAWRLVNNQLQLDGRIRGYWQHTADQATIEIRIPRELLKGPVNLSLNQPGQPQIQLLHRQSLRYPTPELGRWLAALASQGSVLVVDSNGLQIARNEPRNIAAANDNELGLGDRMAYRLLVDNPPSVLSNNAIQQQKRNLLNQALNNQPATAWWQRQSFGTAWLAAAYPIRNQQQQVVGAVLMVQPDNALQGFTNQALARLGLITFGAFAAASLMLLLLATWLSFRIQRLSRAADNAVTEDGRFNTFKPSNAKDEIGDLSRSFADMLKDLQSYTDYLRDLATKLSHELRTPLAIVRSSLDNLEQSSLANHSLDSSHSENDTRQYIQRARDGAVRLSAILTAMSAAKRIEQAIGSAEPETFDLAALLASMTQAYRDTWPEQRFEISNLEHASYTGMPELIAQALDKLVDNAQDFCHKQGRIVLSLEPHEHGFILAVHNDGPALPKTMQGRLFDSMVSLREHQAPEDHNQQHGAPHLGLGLYIVRLVAAAHNGHVTASNELNGVTFKLYLP